MAIGKAGEHLVCADLLLNGQNAMLADQGQPFDVLIIRGKIIVTVQVKSRLKPTQGTYKFKLFQDTPWDNVDMYALVGLEDRKIAYIGKNQDDISKYIAVGVNPLAKHSFASYRFEQAMRFI